MKEWPENFVDTIITDPPYGLDFMGKDWDGDVPGVHFWTEMLRVCKPGAMLLTFGGTRTWHHLATAIEKAGWQIRDCLMWLYGSGFPKSLDISKAIDKAKGAEREVTGRKYEGNGNGSSEKVYGDYTAGHDGVPVTAPATDLARQWSGYGTALKPAWEPIIVAMKPLGGTFAHNAETWGVAGLNVDGGRIEITGKIAGAKIERSPKTKGILGQFADHTGEETWQPVEGRGRWPANLILDEDAAGMLDGVSGACKTGGAVCKTDCGDSIFGKREVNTRMNTDGGSGASRFFYVAKSCRAERNEGCEGMSEKDVAYGDYRANFDTTKSSVSKYPDGSPRPMNKTLNNHPTVKPLELMKYLCMLTKTPTGGIVLDPFAGSGTTLWAAEFHNRPWIGIEMNPEYVAIANARIARERSQIKMAI